MSSPKRTRSSTSIYLDALEKARARYRSSTGDRDQRRLRSCAVCGSLRTALKGWGARLRQIGTRLSLSLGAVKRGRERVAIRVDDEPPIVRLRSWVQRLRRVPQPLVAAGRRVRFRLQGWRERRQRRRHDAAYRFRARHYPGSRDRRYRVHVPPRYNGRTPLPVVMVLHGCRQTHADIQRISAMDEVADREGFLVVYPFVTSYSGLRNRNCWGWWLPDEIHAGAGEVEDLWQILREVKATYRVDERRIHVAGLSSGAGMAVALMVARAGKIASGAAIAGVPYGETARAVGFVHHIAGHFRPVRELVQDMDAEMGEKKRAVPLFVVHSHHDGTVNIRAARNLRDSWAYCFGVDLHKRIRVRHGATGATRWEHTRYRGDNRRSVIETLFLEGVGHGWYGGRPGRYSYPQAPPVSDWLWRFFQTHPMGNPLEETAGTEPLTASIPVADDASVPS